MESLHQLVFEAQAAAEATLHMKSLNLFAGLLQMYDEQAGRMHEAYAVYDTLSEKIHVLEAVENERRALVSMQPAERGGAI